MSIKNNTASLQEILNTINSLPEAGVGGVELPELTNPAQENEIFLNKETIDANGNVKTGTFTIDSELSTQDELITQIQNALANKASGSTTVLQDKTITPSVEQQIITADNGYDGLETVTVNAVPTQTKNITPTTAVQNVTPDNGKFLSKVTVAGDSNLVAENIITGKSIFGVVGSAEVGSGGSGSSETANVTMSINASLEWGTEKLYYISSNGLASVDIFDYELSSFSITCVIPSIIAIQGLKATVSGGITELYQSYGSAGYSSVYYITGSGYLGYEG